LITHKSVSEAGVIGFNHDLKGQGIYAFVVLKSGVKIDDENKLKQELTEICRKEIGAIAKPDVIQFASGLPKTRSGKIMRRILRKIANGETDNFGDTKTLLNPEIIDELIKNRVEK
jgi:acetyl-CoA synthetase